MAIRQSPVQLIHKPVTGGSDHNGSLSESAQRNEPTNIGSKALKNVREKKAHRDKIQSQDHKRLKLVLSYELQSVPCLDKTT
jgi:hypothetical protein